MKNEGVVVEKYTVDTMIFYIFGFTLDETVDEILLSIANKAYNDATNQGAFNTLLSNEIKGDANQIKEKVIKYMSKELKEYTQSKNIYFQKWHSYLGKEVKKQTGNVGPDNTTMRLFNLL